MAMQNGERDPLLTASGANRPSYKADETTFKHEARVMASYILPASAMNFCRYLVMGASLFSISHLGTRELAAANLGLLTCNIGGYAIVIGLCAALDTLANQASRSSSPKLTSLYTLRTAVVCTAAMPLCFLVCWNGELWFRLLVPHSDPELRTLAANYMKIISLGIPPLIYYECIRRYMASLGMMSGPTIAYSFAAPLSVLLNYLLVHGPDNVRLGFYGAPLAVVITYWFIFLVILLYAMLAIPRHTWIGFNRLMFQDLGIVWRYGIAGLASTCSEWYAFEVLSLGAAYLGETTQAATAIYATILSVCWQIPLSISIAVSIRIGNLLGQNLHHKAAKAALTAQILAAAIVLVNAIILLAIKRAIGHAFTDDEEVIAMVDKNMYILAVVTLFDGMQASTTGTLKGAGLPSMAARCNLFSYWVVGLPIGALLTFKTRDIGTLWGGLPLATLTATCTMAYHIRKIDWKDKAEEALMRMKESDENARLLRPETELSA